LYQTNINSAESGSIKNISMENLLQQKTHEWEVERSEAEGKSGDDMAAKFAHIKGWGIDADPDNEPTYPMKHYNGDDHKRLNYDRPVQQLETVEMLQSNERPALSATFGTSSPPSGLSGQLRRFAFRYSEGKWNHWLMLLLADRVNMVEGIIDDMKHGHFPNIIAERGWTAEWKYNRKNFMRNVAIGAAVTAGLFMMMSATKKLRRA
jgi:hypothetical protein